MTGAQNMYDGSRLLRLHLAWPERDQHRGSVSEAEAFFLWLKENHGSVAIVRRLAEADELDDFLSASGKLLARRKAVSGGRQERRVPSSVRVHINVLSCESDPELAGLSAFGMTRDVGARGLCIFCPRRLPIDALLRLTLTPVGLPITIFHLVGSPRWSTPDGEGQILGVELSEREDSPRWGKEFSSRFSRT